MGARVFMPVTNKGTTFAIYAIPITESVKRPEALPTCYKEYQDVFEKKMQIYFLITVHMIV